MADAFFIPDGDAYVPTELTRGPWDPEAQHAGPPAGLLARAIERHPGGDAAHVARITLDILRPIPLRPLTVQTRVVRPGRSVELLEAVLSDSENELVTATAWRLRTQEVELQPDLETASPPAGPEHGADGPFFPTGVEVGYHVAMDYRFVSGGWLDRGPATVWMRMRQALVRDEEPSPLVRVMTAADTGNGISSALDYSRFTFINVDLTVHLHRLPAGEWVCLDAITFPEPNGVGLADTALHDERGRIGRATQTLLVRGR